MSDSVQETSSHSAKNYFDNAKNLLTYEPSSKFIEMSNLGKKNKFKNLKIEETFKDDTSMLKYKNCK